MGYFTGRAIEIPCGSIQTEARQSQRVAQFYITIDSVTTYVNIPESKIDELIEQLDLAKKYINGDI